MHRFLLHLALLPFSFSFLFLPAAAHACSCSHPYATDYIRSVDQVFDGYIESISRDESGKYPVMKALIRVKKVWKGMLPDTVIFAYGEADAACQYGRIRAKVYHRFYTRGDPEKGSLGASWCDRVIAGPRNTALQRELRRYADRWQELSAKAKAGGVAEKFVFAQFLLDHGDEGQALDAYQEVVRIDEGNAAAWLGLSEALANLGRAEESTKTRERAGSLSPAMRGPVLRAEFERTGRLDPTWKDWSNLTTRNGCVAEGMKLEGMSFGGSRLYKCSFKGSRLESIDFTGADVYEPNFSGTILRNVRFGKGLIRYADFQNADVADVELTGQVGASFANARLVRIQASGLVGSLEFQHAHLSDVNFSNSSLRHLDARDAIFENVDFNGADLSYASLQGADLTATMLKATKFEMAHIDCQTKVPPALDIRQLGIIPEEPTCGEHAQNRDFSNRSWKHADFKKLDLRGANFSGSDLNIAHFQDADLRGANLSNTVGLGGLGFLRGANLDGAVLDGAKVEQLTVGGISLKGATFRGAIIQMRDIVSADPRFSSIDLDEPNFSDAVLDCGTYSFEWLDRQKPETQRHVAEQVKVEVAAMNQIRAKWPTAKQTPRCTQYLSEFQARYP